VHGLFKAAPVTANKREVIPMSNQEKNGGKMFCDCFPGMQEMMRATMQSKGKSCCLSGQSMSEMMSKCCSSDQKEDKTEKPDRKNPE